MRTITWTNPDGSTVDIEYHSEVDEWTGRELRAVERLNGGVLGGGYWSTIGFLAAISASRGVPGLTIEEADAQLTFGRLTAIRAELLAQDRAEAEAAADAAAEAVPEEGEVLSPTRPGGPGDSQPSE